MRRALGMAVVAATLGMAAFASAAAASLVADYRFAGGYGSSVPGADDAFPSGANGFATEAVAGCNRQVLTFAADNGVAIHGIDLIGAGPTTGPYTIIVQTRLEGTPADEYDRIINWDPNFSDDNGLYLHFGKLDFYDENDSTSDHEGTGVVGSNVYAELAVTRDASKLVTGYVNGVPQFSYTDAFDVAVSDHPVGNIYFFRDDSGEESAGAVSRIRVYNTALPANQIINTVGCMNQRCGGSPATITGDGRDNTLVGTPGRDVVAALGGNDIVRGLAGRDLLCGNAGRDRLLGGRGRDRLIGAKGRDTCRGGKGRDRRRGCELGRG